MSDVTILEKHFTGDTVIFKALLKNDDGSPSTTTPASAACSVWNESGTAVVSAAAGTVGAGFAQYAWATGSATGKHRAVLSVTIASGNIQSQEFEVSLEAKPPTFTTDPGTDIGWVRMMLGDDRDGQGVYPDGRNLTDAQITTLLTNAGNKTAALSAACTLLANVWARMADVEIGPRSEKLSQVASRYEKRAKDIASGMAAGNGGAFGVGLQRDDGYHQYATGTGEYA